MSVFLPNFISFVFIPSCCYRPCRHSAMLVPSGQDVAMSEDDTTGRLLLADRVRFGTDRGWSSSLLAASHDRLLAMSLLDDVVVAPPATKTILLKFFPPPLRTLTSACTLLGVGNGIEHSDIHQQCLKTLYKQRCVLTRSNTSWAGDADCPTAFGRVDETKTPGGGRRSDMAETHCLWTWTSATVGACRPA